MLYSLGLRVHLGHDGDACPCPRSILEGFTVFDINGIHLAGLVFCGCVGAPRNNIQLLRMRWFPGTVKDPHSAYTFDVLNTFHLLNLQGKLSLHDFYRALHRKCDNAGVHEYKVCIPHSSFNQYCLMFILRIVMSKYSPSCAFGATSRWLNARAGATTPKVSRILKWDNVLLSAPRVLAQGGTYLKDGRMRRLTKGKPTILSAAPPALTI